MLIFQIAHGVSFRFEELKDIFYAEFLENEKDKKNLMPTLNQLSQNFRTHKGVVDLANSVVELIVHFFPLSIDVLLPECSRVAGPRPIVLRSSQDFVSQLFTSQNSLHSCDFGAEQVILVRDESSKQSVLQISGNRALVLTVLEAKGMEFTDCLVYNFFTSSPLGKEWRVLFNAMKSQKENCPKFNDQKHRILCVELKLLYVLLTRARQHLLIYEYNMEHVTPMLKYWCEEKNEVLVEERELDDDIRDMFRSSSSPAEWKQRGEQLFERKQFLNARLCYERADDTLLMRLCDAHITEQKADQLALNKPPESQKLFKEAAVMFIALPNQKQSAVRCFEKAGAWSQAAQIYLDMNKYSDAARCFTKCRMWRDAAFAYDKIREYDNTLDCCYECSDFDLALSFLNTWKDSLISDALLLNEIENKMNDCLKRAARYYHNNRDNNRMMIYVFRFRTTKEKRLFLSAYKHFDRLLDIEVADECYEEAAKICESLFNFKKAGEYYEKADMYDEACRCAVTGVRMKMLDSSFVLQRDMLSREDFKYLERVRDDIVMTETCKSGELWALYIEVLLLGSRPRLDKLKNLLCKAKKIGIDAWPLQLMICRVASAQIDDLFAQDNGNCDWHLSDYICQEIDAVVSMVIGAVSSLEKHGNMNLLPGADRHAVACMFDFFVLKLEANSLASNRVIGSTSLLGLKNVFGITKVNPNPSTVSTSLADCKMNMIEFSQGAIKFLREFLVTSHRKCIQLIKEELLNMMPETYESRTKRFLDHYSKRKPFVHTTKHRTEALIALKRYLSCDWLQQQQDYGEQKKMAKDLEIVADNVVDIVLPSMSGLDDLKAVVAARKDSEIRLLVSKQVLENVHCGLKFEPVLRNLLLGEITEKARLIADKMSKEMEVNLRRIVDADNRNDIRCKLLAAFQFEHSDYVQNPAPGWSQGSFLWAINLGVEALGDDLYRGGIAIATNRITPGGLSDDRRRRFYEREPENDIITYSMIVRGALEIFSKADDAVSMNILVSLLLAASCLRQNSVISSSHWSNYVDFGCKYIRGKDVSFLFSIVDIDGVDTKVALLAPEILQSDVDESHLFGVSIRFNDKANMLLRKEVYGSLCHAMFWWAKKANITDTRPFLSYNGKLMLSQSDIHNALGKIAVHCNLAKERVQKESYSAKNVKSFILTASGAEAALSDRHGCFAPRDVIRLMEKLGVLLLLQYKCCKDVVIPNDLAMDVLMRKNKSYADAIRRFRSSNNKPLDDSHRLLKKLCNDILNLLESLDFEKFRNWKKSSADPLSSTTSSDDQNSLNDFLCRSLILLSTILENFSFNDMDRKNLFGRLQIMIRGVRIFSGLPYYFKMFVKDLNSMTNITNLKEYCKNYCDGPLLLLHCIHGVSLNKLGELYHLTRMVVDVEGDENVVIVSSSETDNIDNKFIEPDIEQSHINEGEEPLSSSLEEEEEGGISMESLQALAPAAAMTEEEKKLLRIKRFEPTIKELLRLVRYRITRFTSLDKLSRSIERDIMGFGFLRTSDAVQLYVNKLCPKLIELQYYYDKVEDFLRSHEEVR